MKIALDRIHSNPHRNMTRNPVTAAQIKVITDSIERNDWGENVIVRPSPGRRGHYQLAYGHTRLAALRKLDYKAAEFIVKDVTDWGMYSWMVDENESQRNITPELIHENVEAGINYLEPLVRECETVEEFTEAVEISTASTLGKQYGTVRNNLLAGQGLGVGFLSKVLPGDRSTDRNNIQVVCDSHYGKQKEQAKTTRSKAKRKAASAKRKSASAAKDAAAARKLDEEADALDKQADNLMNEAEKLKASANVDSLLLFKNAAQMTTFAKSVKHHKIPRDKHVELAQKLIADGTGSQNYEREINLWWFKASGKASKARAKADRDTFKRKHQVKSLDEFAGKTVYNIRDLIKELDNIAPFAQQIQSARLKGSLVTACRNVEHAAKKLREMIDAEPTEVSISEAQKLLKETA